MSRSKNYFLNYCYINLFLDKFWIIDYRIFDLEGDGKNKLEHVHDMLTNCVYHKQLQFHAVLMDTWYTAKEIMLYIEKVKKLSYCPLKDNRQGDDSGATAPYCRVDSLKNGANMNKNMAS